MTEQEILRIQSRLKALGYNPGPIDGIRGRLTDRAILAFKISRDLRARPYLGPITLAALFEGAKPAERVKAPVARQPDMPWMDEAARHLGLREISGAKHNSTIVGWLERLKAPWRDDETAWCGTFVGYCIAATLPREALPANPFGARQWLPFGRESEPGYGCILVFWRGSRSGWQGHVGFMLRMEGDYYVVRGGNQANSVSDTRIHKSRLLGARMPKTHLVMAAAEPPPAPPGGIIPISTNEA